MRLHWHNRYWTFTALSQHCHITIRLEPICVTTFHHHSQDTTDSDYVLCKEMIALCIVLDNLHWWILVIVLCNAMSQKSVSTQGQSSLPVWSVSCVRDRVCLSLLWGQDVTLNTTSSTLLMTIITVTHYTLKTQNCVWQCCVLTLLVSVILKC